MDSLPEINNALGTENRIIQFPIRFPVKAAFATASLLVCGLQGSLAWPQTACEHFDSVFKQFTRQHPRVGIDELNARELCFDHCTNEQTRASQF